MIAGSATDDVEHFEDRHAAADELRERPRKARHANLMKERPENRELQLPAIRESFAAGRAQKSANTEEYSQGTPDEKIPIAAHEIAYVN